MRIVCDERMIIRRPKFVNGIEVEVFMNGIDIILNTSLMRETLLRTVWGAFLRVYGYRTFLALAIHFNFYPLSHSTRPKRMRIVGGTSQA